MNKIVVVVVVVVVLLGSATLGMSISANQASQVSIAASGGNLAPTASPTPTETQTVTSTVVPSSTATETAVVASQVTASSTPAVETAVVLQPTATSPPRFTPTLTPTVTSTVTSTSTPTAPASPTSSPVPPGVTDVNGAASSVPRTATTVPTATPPPTATVPTATPTPAFDYVVQSTVENRLPNGRDIAYIHVRLVDRNGQLIPGAQFVITADGVPPYTAVAPVTPGDGTAVFPVTRGRFNLRVVAGRSQTSSWLVTGSTGVPQMSDWDVVFQSTH